MIDSNQEEPHTNYSSIADMRLSLYLILIQTNRLIDFYLFNNSACAALNESIANNSHPESCLSQILQMI